MISIMQYIYATHKSPQHRWLALVAQTFVCATLLILKKERFMPRRSILSKSELDSFFALPDLKDDLIRFYTFNESDISIIKQRRGEANRLGFAVQLCYMRYPGIFLSIDESPNVSLLRMVSNQLKIPVNAFDEYGQRAETRRDHLLELQSIFGFQPFTKQHYRPSVRQIELLARDTDKGVLLATELVESLRRQNILLPSPNVIERICAEG